MERIDLDALDALLTAASPGEWCEFHSSLWDHVKTATGDWVVKHGNWRDTGLIVSLRNAAPALISELRRLRKIEDAARNTYCACPDGVRHCICGVAKLHAALETGEKECQD